MKGIDAIYAYEGIACKNRPGRFLQVLAKAESEMEWLDD